MALSTESIIAIVTLVMTCPPSALLLYKIHERHRSNTLHRESKTITITMIRLTCIKRFFQGTIRVDNNTQRAATSAHSILVITHKRRNHAAPTSDRTAINMRYANLYGHSGIATNRGFRSKIANLKASTAPASQSCQNQHINGLGMIFKRLGNHYNHHA
jgi:hypothetical protein